MMVVQTFGKTEKLNHMHRLGIRFVINLQKLQIEKLKYLRTYN